MCRLVRSACTLLAATTLLSLAFFVSADYYQPQALVPTSATLSATCTPLAATSALVAQYGAQYEGMCAFSFCYQLYTTPFPNQDPNSASFAASGFFFTNSTLDTTTAASLGQLPGTDYGQSNNASYSVLGAVGTRTASQFLFNQSCGAPNTSTSITGVFSFEQSAGAATYPNDNLVLLGYPYVTLGGIGLLTDQSLYWPYGAAESFSGCSTFPPSVSTGGGVQLAQIAQGLLDTYDNYPQTSLVYEYGYGTTNFAAINVQPYTEGGSTAFPSCPYYTAPTTMVYAFSYFVQQTVGSSGQLVQSSCVSASVTASGPYQRYAGLNSYVLYTATGTRSFTDVHNRTTVQSIVGVTAPNLINANTALQGRTLTDLPTLAGYPLYPDNALNLDASNSLSPNSNGILFQLDSVPYSGALSVAETTSLLFARSTNDGWVAEVAVDDNTEASDAAWTTAFGGQGIVTTSGGDGNFSLALGSFSWQQSQVYSGATCPVGVPSATFTPGTTNYADPSGLTQVGFGYRSVVGYYGPGAQPAASTCIAGILTLDLTLGDGVRAPVANATGVRVYATSAGYVETSALVSVPYNAYTLASATYNPSYFYYDTTSQQDVAANPYGSPIVDFGLRFNQTVSTYQGPSEDETSLHFHNDLPTTSASGIVLEYAEWTNSNQQPWYQLDLPPTFAVFPLSAASPFVPSAYCPSSTAQLNTAPNLTTSSASTTQTLSIAYSVVPNNFNPSNEWLVCTNLQLTLSTTAAPLGLNAGSGVLASAFQVVNASGTRAYVSLATGTGVIANIVGVAGPADLPSQQPIPDNLVSLTSPYLSFNGLGLVTSTVPTYSTGAYGPSAFALQLTQNVATQKDLSGQQWSAIFNGVQETSSPDGSSSTSVYFTAGAATPQEQDCDAIVAKLQQDAAYDSTITVTFSYSIQATSDTAYGSWTVCVTGSLTLLSTPLYLSSSAPNGYVVKGVTGTRTFFNSWGQASVQNIVGAAVSSATDANVFVPNRNGNYFPTGGLSFALAGPGLVDNSGVNPAASAVNITVTTAVNQGVLSILENAGDYSHVAAAAYVVGGSLPDGSGRLTGCPVTAYPSAPTNVTVYFSISWTSTSQMTSVCLQGTLTVATQAVATQAASSFSYYPVLAASGTRVVTDLMLQQSYSQAITGVAPAFSVPIGGGAVNDNLLALPSGVNVATVVGGSGTLNLGLVLAFNSSVYYSTGLGGTTEQLVTGVSTSNVTGVVDPSFSADAVQSLAISVSPPAGAVCTVLINQALAPASAVTYYFQFNGTINNNEAAECMSGTVTTGTSVNLNGMGQVAYAVTGATGTRYYWDSATNTAQAAAITGLATLTGYLNGLVPAPGPGYLSGPGAGFGLAFNTSILQPASPSDQFLGQSSTFNSTALSTSRAGQVFEANQYTGVSGSTAVFSLGSTAASVPSCSLSTVTQGHVNQTGFVQLFYNIAGPTPEPFSFCASLIVEYDASGNGQVNQNGQPGYTVVSISGNRTWQTASSPVVQVQTVLSLDRSAGDNTVFPTGCPVVDDSGINFDVSCPTCQPAGQGNINLYIYRGQCGKYVDENTWYDTWSDNSNSMNTAPYILGQPLAFQCPTGVAAGSVGTGSGTGGAPTGGVPSGALGLEGGSSYQFAYVLQGAALNVQSGNPNWYDTWAVIVSGSVTLAFAPSQGPSGSLGYAIVSATGTRTFIDGTGAVTVQSIVGVANGTNVQPSFVYAPASGAFADSVGWSLLLNGSVATPTGPSLSNVLTLQQSSSPALGPSLLPPNTTSESIVERTQSSGGVGGYVDSTLLLPLLLTNTTGAATAAVSSLTTSLLSAAAAQQTAAVLPSASVSSSLQVYFQYTLSQLSAANPNVIMDQGNTPQPFWQVCASGTLTVDTTRGATIEGRLRYPVTAATGQRTFTQYGLTYLAIVLGGGTTTPANSTVQTITGVSSVGMQGADDYIAFTPNTATASLVNVTNDGLGLVLSTPAVYQTGISWSSQVTLALSTANQNGVQLGTFALSEAYGPPSAGQLLASATPLSCPAPASSGVLTLPASQLWLLVYALNYSTSSSNSTSPSFSCGVLSVTVSGLAVDTPVGSGLPILLVRGYHYATTGGETSAQPVNAGASTTYVSLLYTSAQSPAVVDTNGIQLTGTADPSLSFDFFYSASSQYVERGNGVLSGTNIYLLPGPQIASVPSGQAACFYQPFAAVAAPPASSSSSSSSSSSPSSSASSSASAIPSAVSSSASSATSAASSLSAVLATSATAAPSTAAPSSTSAATVTSAATSPATSTPASSGTTSTPQPSVASSSSSPSSIASSAVVVTPSFSSSSSSSSAVPASSTSSSSSGLSHGAIAGIVIGSVVGAILLCLACVLLFLFCRDGGEGRHEPSKPSSASDASVIRPSSLAPIDTLDNDIDHEAVRPAAGQELEMQEV